MPPIQPFEQHHFIFKSKDKESKRLSKCFLNYLRRDKTEVGVLFDMLSVFLVRTCIDYTYLKNFYMIEVAEEYNPQMKKALLVHFLHLFEFKELSQDHLVISMQILILPMLAHSFQYNQSWDVVDASMINTIVKKLLDLQEEMSAEYDEPLKIELLQLSTLLLKYLPNDLVHYRKELFKFGWNHLKREDSACRQWALVNVCQFLEAYQAPEKIVVKVFVALLRTCQPENKVLVNQALDILMPTLSRRLPVGGYKTPIWILCTRKILLEEGHLVPTLIHIFQLIVRYSDLFYSYRSDLVPHMVYSLSCLGSPQNIPPDNRRIALEVSGLVIGWEKQCQAKSKTMRDSEGHAQPMDMSISASLVEGELSGAATNSKQPFHTSGFADELTKRAKTESGFSSFGVMFSSGTSIQSIGTPGAAAQSDEEYKPNAAMKEIIINFLIGVALVREAKDNKMSAMHKQALGLLSQALEVWPTTNIKFNYLEELLSRTNVFQQPLYRSWLAEADLRNSFDLYSLHQHWDKDVFLSHSGKQKNFVRQLYRDLTREHVSCFFDKDYNSLPLGQAFPHLMFKAAETCRIAVLVLSKDFILSKWSMLELSAFISAIKSRKNANLNLLPILFMITPKELSHITEYSPKWQELGVSNDTRVEWEDALKVVRSMRGLQFDEDGNEVQLRDDVVKGICYLKRINHPHLHDFHPVVDVKDAFTTSSLQQPWDKDVFLSYSGKQKNFVRQLYRDLTREHVSCFFDEDYNSLPPGERIGTLTFQAVETCRIAVFVLSKDFILSKWPMLELSAFIRAIKSGKNANIKLFPIFYMITPRELFHITKDSREWQALRVSDEIRGEWKDALNEVRCINGFLFVENGDEVQLRDEVVKRICCFLKRINPSHLLDFHPEADIRDAFGISSLQRHWDKDVFLSHSGKQKNFVRQLYRDLTRKHVSCFFDEDYNSLPLDQWFPSILNAVETCRIAVLVLSKDFILSKWPMLELSAFISAIKSGKNANLMLLPIFFMIFPGELSHITKDSPEWQELRVSDDTRGKWKDALKEVSCINGFLFVENGDEVQLRDEVVKTICYRINPSHPSHLLDYHPATTEVDVKDAFDVSSLQQHWDKDVFLSHSGKQKNFVRQLYRDLTRERVSCFFDEDYNSLPLGERIATRTFIAVETCRIAVLVLSKDFVLSKWPMLELSAFIRAIKSGKNANLKLLPIFFMITPRELSHITKYSPKWQELGVSNDTTVEWEDALKVVRSMMGYEFDEDGNEIQLRDAVVKEICCLLK